MFSKPIEIWDAVITAIHHNVEDGAVQSRILVTGTLNPDLADELGTKTLVFASNGTPKGGFSKLELDTGCAAFRAVFEADRGSRPAASLARRVYTFAARTRRTALPRTFTGSPRPGRSVSNLAT